VRLDLLFRPRASLYGQFCVCRLLQDGVGHSCAHALCTVALLALTAFVRIPDNSLCILSVGALQLRPPVRQELCAALC